MADKAGVLRTTGDFSLLCFDGISGAVRTRIIVMYDAGDVDLVVARKLLLNSLVFSVQFRDVDVTIIEVQSQQDFQPVVSTWFCPLCYFPFCGGLLCGKLLPICRNLCVWCVSVA